MRQYHYWCLWRHDVASIENEKLIALGSNDMSLLAPNAKSIKALSLHVWDSENAAIVNAIQRCHATTYPGSNYQGSRFKNKTVCAQRVIAAPHMREVCRHWMLKSILRPTRGA
jgi:hypothetical protein